MFPIAFLTTSTLSSNKSKILITSKPLSLQLLSLSLPRELKLNSVKCLFSSIQNLSSKNLRVQSGQGGHAFQDKDRETTKIEAS